MNQLCNESVYNVYHFINHSCVVLYMHKCTWLNMCSVVCDVSRKCVHYYMYTNLLYELGLVGMKGKCGMCKVTAGNDVCIHVYVYCVIQVITWLAHSEAPPSASGAHYRHGLIGREF